MPLGLSPGQPIEAAEEASRAPLDVYRSTLEFRGLICPLERTIPADFHPFSPQLRPAFCVNCS